MPVFEMPLAELRQRRTATHAVGAIFVSPNTGLRVVRRSRGRGRRPPRRRSPDGEADTKELFSNADIRYQGNHA
jgi:hypothetical protein